MSVIPHLGTIATLARLGSGGGGGIQQNENFTLQMATQSLNPLDSTTYRIRNGFVTTSTDAGVRVQVPKKCTLTRIYMRIRQQTGGVSTETSTIQILVNGTTSYNVSTTVNVASSTLVSNTSLNIPLEQGDYISIRWLTPAWATNPTSILTNAVLWCQPPRAAKGFYIIQGSPGSLNPTDASSNLMADSMVSTVAGSVRQYFPANGKVVGAQIYAFVGGVVGSGEQFSYVLSVNGVDAETITSTASLNAVHNVFSNLGMNTNISAGDYCSIRIAAPTRATNPTSVVHSFNLIIQEV